MSDSLRPHESQHARPPCPSPTSRVHPNPYPLSRWCHPAISSSVVPFSSWPQSNWRPNRESLSRLLLLLLLSCFSRVWLCATPQTAAQQAPPSLGFSRQDHWSGLPFPSPMHESEKWKGSRSVMSNSLRPHGLQPIRLLRPRDFPVKSTGVGCHCLFRGSCWEGRKNKSWKKGEGAWNLSVFFGYKTSPLSSFSS